jgi:toxin CptA
VQFPITIGLRRSRILDVMLLLTVLLATVANAGFQCSLLIHAGLFLATLVLAALAWRSLIPTIKAVRLERNGDIFVLRVGEHDFVRAIPEPCATVHPWLSVIRLTAAGGLFDTLIVAPDSQNKADFTRLRMFMRWQANFSELIDDA